jgi:hypothetical protein
VQFSPSHLVRGEVKLVGTFGYRNEFPQTIDLLRSGKVHLTSLVTDFFSLAEINAGFQRQLAKDQAMKVMIQPQYCVCGVQSIDRIYLLCACASTRESPVGLPLALAHPADISPDYFVKPPPQACY